MVNTSAKIHPRGPWKQTTWCLPLTRNGKTITDVLFGSPIFPTAMISRLVNSIIITVSVTVLSAFFGGLAATTWRATAAPSPDVLFVLVGIALYLPYQAVIIPLVTIMAKTHLALSYWGMILSYLMLYMPVGLGPAGHILPCGAARAGGSRRSGRRLQGADLLPHRCPRSRCRPTPRWRLSSSPRCGTSSSWRSRSPPSRPRPFRSLWLLRKAPPWCYITCKWLQRLITVAIPLRVLLAAGQILRARHPGWGTEGVNGYTQAHIRDFLTAVREWASQNIDIQAVALVGSYAHEG